MTLERTWNLSCRVLSSRTGFYHPGRGFIMVKLLLLALGVDGELLPMCSFTSLRCSCDNKCLPLALYTCFANSLLIGMPFWGLGVWRIHFEQPFIEPLLFKGLCTDHLINRSLVEYNLKSLNIPNTQLAIMFTVSLFLPFALHSCLVVRVSSL